MKAIDEKKEFLNTEIFYHQTIMFFKKHPDDVYENYKYLDLSRMIEILGKYNEQSLERSFLYFVMTF